MGLPGNVLYLNCFMELNWLLWGLLRKYVIFKLFYRFKYVFMGFFDKLMGFLWIIKDI
jgi:hypothetical protein